MSMLHQLALARLRGVGPVLARKLIEHYGDEEAVFRESERDLLNLSGQGTRIARSFRPSAVAVALREAEAELKYIDRSGIRSLFFRDVAYPRRLKDCYDAPLVLFCKGEMFADRARVLSIVGSRKATREGMRLCSSLIAGLKSYDPVIVSGLAYGIDVTAHEAALKNDLPTIGVLGHGLDHMYPAAHHRISREITGSGGLVSEWFHDVRPAPGNFPRRNRIVAGLADATIVVEAGKKGGALITADIAASYNRDVFAFPGRVNDEHAKGCLQMIRDHKAQLIAGADDLVQFLGWDPAPVKTPALPAGDAVMSPTPGRNSVVQPIHFGSFSENEQEIMRLIRENDGISLDKLMTSTKISRECLCSSLIKMEIGGYLENIPGKGYVLV